MTSYLSLHPNLRIRIVVGAVQRFLAIMVMPLMTIYLAAAFGVTRAGIMMVGVALTEITGSLLGGHLSDLHGRRPLLIAGESGVAAATAVMAAAAAPFWHSPLVLYCAFLVSSFAAATALPSNDAMIIDVTESDVRKFVYTINYWAINLALACGVIVGAFLYANYFDYLLVAVAAGYVTILVITILKITETARRTRSTQSTGRYLKDFFVGYRLVLGNGLFAALLLAATLRLALEVQINYYINVRVSRTFGDQVLFHIGSWVARVTGVEILGILRAENTLLVVVLALLVLKLLKRIGDRFRLYIGITLFTVGTMAMGVGNTPWILLGAMLVLTIGEILNVPVQQAMLADLVPEHSRTKYMAMYAMNVRMALLIASLCLTLGAWLGPWGMAALYAVFGLTIALGYRIVLAGMQRTAVSEQVPASTH